MEEEYYSDVQSQQGVGSLSASEYNMVASEKNEEDETGARLNETSSTADISDLEETTVREILNSTQSVDLSVDMDNILSSGSSSESHRKGLQTPTPLYENDQIASPERRSYLSAPFTHAVVHNNDEEEVSTLADDTVGGGSIVRESSIFRKWIDAAPEPQNELPSSRFLLSEPIKSIRSCIGRSDSNKSPQQEISEMVVRVPSKATSKSTTSKDGSHDDPKGAFKLGSHEVSYRRFYVYAIVMALVLLLVICVLAGSYRRLQDKDSDLNNESPWMDGWEDDLIFSPGSTAPIQTAAPVSTPTPPPVSTPVASPVSSPPPSVPVAGPSSLPSAMPVSSPIATPATTPTSFPTMTPTIAKTASPTLSPTVTAPAVPTASPQAISVDAKFDMMELLASRGVDVANWVQNANSPRFRSLQWLAAHPNYFDLTDTRLIQLWVLGVLGLSWTIDEAGRSPAGAVLEGWMDYDSDECTWFTTEDNDICNGDGYYEVLSLENQQLYGTLPSELGLLSSHLRLIDFRGNNLYGTIPTDIQELTNLVRLQLTTNSLTGEIPTVFGSMTNLEVLGLGRNDLHGTIPTEMGSMSKLNTLGIETNYLSGTIPAEFGNLDNLEIFVLGKNRLTGTVPVALGNLDDLQILYINGNRFTGSIPLEVCALDNLDDLVADCHLVECSCCTECSDPEPPTSAPSAVSSEPTVCSEFLTFDAVDCSANGVDNKWEIAFQNCDVQNGDWIAIFEADTDPSDLHFPLLWVWACGSQSCRGSPPQNDFVVSSAWWTLESDKYYTAYLLRNTESPYEVVMQSEPIRPRTTGC